MIGIESLHVYAGGKKMKEAVMLCFGGVRGEENLKNAYDEMVRQELESRLKFHKPITSLDDLQMRAMTGQLAKVHYVFSTWGMPYQATSDIQRFAPNLEAVFYAAGSVQGFARPYLNAGVRVFSAYKANAVPVAEYTLAQVILAGKGFYQSQQLYKDERKWQEAKDFSHGNTGNYGQTVGLLGAGEIGRLVIGHLKPFNYNILVFDPFLSDEAANRLGVTKADLNTLFKESDIISNHLANNEHTQGILHKEHFDLMKPYSTFINTGRGAQVVEADLIAALKADVTRTAVLDVTWPEPLPTDSPFYELKNLFVTPHIAGSQSLEIARMGKYMLDALNSYEAEGQSEHEVTVDMLETMA